MNCVLLSFVLLAATDALGQPSRDNGKILLRLQNNGNAYFFTNVSAGTPAQNFSVAFDTATSLSWLPSSDCSWSNPACLKDRKFDAGQSSTFVKVGTPWTLYQQDTNLSGLLSKDTLGLGGVNVQGQVFGEATQIPGGTFALASYDGVWGLGPTREGDAPGLLDNLLAQGVISSKAFGFYMKRNTSEPLASELSIGGADESKFSGDLVPVPLVDQGTRGYRVVIDKFSANGSDYCTRAGGCEALVAWGYAMIGVPMDIAADINGHLGASQLHEGEWTFDCDKVDALPDVTFLVAGKVFTISRSQYVYVTQTPVGKYCFSGFEGQTYLPSEAPYWILGDTWLGTYYALFDVDRKQVSFAPQV